MSSIIERFISGKYEVTRSKGVKYVDGFPEPQGEETIAVRGSLQPASPRETKQVEEGYRLKQLWAFYSDQPLLVIGTGAKLSRADVVRIKDDSRGSVETYKVLSVESWQGFGLTYFKSIIAREPENQ